jgi:GNAT superfamily N-acetyltransferase
MTVTEPRLARAADVGEILRLAEELYAAMHTRTYASWREAAREDLLARLGDDLVAVVMDGPDGGLISMAVAVVGRGIRSPRRPTTATGTLEWMVTDGRFQRTGVGTAVLAQLLAELRRREVTAVDLSSSDRAIEFYRRAGFAAEGPAAMRLRLLPVPDEARPR